MVSSGVSSAQRRSSFVLRTRRPFVGTESSLLDFCRLPLIASLNGLLRLFYVASIAEVIISTLQMLHNGIVQSCLWWTNVKCIVYSQDTATLRAQSVVNDHHAFSHTISRILFNDPDSISLRSQPRRIVRQQSLLDNLSWRLYSGLGSQQCITNILFRMHEY